MTEAEFKQIIKEENIQYFNWFDEHELRENELGIKLKNGVWLVYATSERAGIINSSVFEFNNEGDALEHFVMRLRSDKKLRDRGYV